jgi:regulator of replication initiation timing
MDERIKQLEADAERLMREVASVRAQVTAAQETETLRTENLALRTAVTQYAVACAQVDLQVALVRARGDSGAADSNLKSLMDQEAAASRVLRDLARTLQEIL